MLPSNPKQLDRSGLAFLKELEGLKLEAYPDPGSALAKACIANGLALHDYRKVPDWERLSGSPWTIGYGCTHGVAEGMRITETQAEELLRLQVWPAEQAVSRLVDISLSQAEFNALVSLAYNIGVTGFRTSTVLRLLNQGDRRGAAKAFMMWNRPAIIITRRQKEQELFESGAAGINRE